MLNLPETILECKVYFLRDHSILKTFILIFAGTKCIDYIRLQIAEITLLQLMPGFYLSLVFGFSLLILLFSIYLIQFINRTDTGKKRGTKAFIRLNFSQDQKSRSSIYSINSFVFFWGVIPLSFESFTVIATQNLASLWSISEFINLEISLGFLLFVIVQLPFFVSGPDYSLLIFQIVPRYLRDYLFIVTILSGICTPTVDIATQLNFIIIGISFYILMTLLIRKKGERICFA